VTTNDTIVKVLDVEETAEASCGQQSVGVFGILG
jgi:hypothetical protein